MQHSLKSISMSAMGKVERRLRVMNGLFIVANVYVRYTPEAAVRIPSSISYTPKLSRLRTVSEKIKTASTELLIFDLALLEE